MKRSAIIHSLKDIKTDSTGRIISTEYIQPQILSLKYFEYVQLGCTVENVTRFLEVTAFILGEISFGYHPAE